jgi:acyl-coenzyme A thioesterase PaaI-like protein
MPTLWDPLVEVAKTTWKNQVSGRLSAVTQANLYLKAFGVTKVPLLGFISPTVLELSDSRCEIKIPLNYRTKNHLGSLYFGVLSAGADVAGGLMAMRLIQASGQPVSLVFKDFHADFLKRAEGDTHFLCESGDQISELVKKTIETGERQNLQVQVVAIVPSLSPEPVAQFTLTLSLKKRS